MKVYFAYSIYCTKQQVEMFRNYFESRNITLITRKIPTDPKTIDFKEAEQIFNSNVKNIKASDLILVEASYASSGLGYDIALALQEKKPVLVFYNMSINKDDVRHIKNVPVDLKGNKNRYLILKEYDTANFEKLLDIAIADAKALTDTKFILIIPPEIDRYLEWNVKEKGISKAEITRKAVEEKMANDKEYSEYTKSFSASEE